MSHNSSRSIIVIYFLMHFYCHFLNSVTVGHSNFRKNRNNQVQNWYSTVSDFLQKNDNHYQLRKRFSCQSRGSTTKYFSCIIIRKVIFHDLLEYLFKSLRATTHFQAFMKPSLDSLSNLNLTSFNPMIIRDSPEGTKYLHFIYAFQSHFR